MVNYSAAPLDATFGALADPTRRAILARLARGEAMVTELAEPFAMSLPAISKHLRVLELAGLLQREIDGRIHRCRLAAGPMKDAAAWIAQAKGEKETALKLLRAAADLEDDSEKHIAMENRLYPMRELLGDLLLEQQQPGLALAEYETSLVSTPNRLRGLYGAAKAAKAANQPEKATTYFRKLAEMTKDADTDRVEISEAKASSMQQ